MNIGHGAWILIGDGEKALFLVNQGDATLPVLETLRVMDNHNPPTGEQGADAPGRMSDGPGPHRSAVQNTDWHEIEKHRFAKEVADFLYKAAHANRFSKLVVAAPPKTLGDLRKEFHPEVSERIVAEIGKDFTNEPPYEIEKHLAAA